jgi:hypothetical protein
MSQSDILIFLPASDEEDKVDSECVSPRGCYIVHPIWEIQFCSERTLFIMCMSLEKSLNKLMYLKGNDLNFKKKKKKSWMVGLLV